MLFEVQAAQRCVKNRRGQWNCDHTHHVGADVAPWEAPDGWTAQGGNPEQPPSETHAYTCSLCDALLWEHELDQHSRECQ